MINLLYAILEASTIQRILFLEIVILLVLSARSDFKTYKISNEITYIACAVGLLTNCYYKGIEGISQSLLGIIMPILLLWVFYSVRMIGAGDIKLFSAIGAIMGMDFTLYTILYSFLCGGILAIILMLYRKNLKYRIHYFISYLKACLTQGLIKKYTDFSIKDDSKFHFSLAIMIGTVFNMLI